MATVTREIAVTASPGVVWSRLSDVGGINTLIDFLGEVTVDGDRRTCSLGEGGVLEELILSVDPDSRRVAYSIRESGLGFEHHSASMQALDDGAGGTRLVWITDFKPDSATPAVEEVVDMAAASIERALA